MKNPPKYRVTTGGSVLNYYSRKGEAVDYAIAVEEFNPEMVCRVERFDVNAEEYVACRGE